MFSKRIRMLFFTRNRKRKRVEYEIYIFCQHSRRSELLFQLLSAYLQKRNEKVLFLSLIFYVLSSIPAYLKSMPMSHAVAWQKVKER